MSYSKQIKHFAIENATSKSKRSATKRSYYKLHSGCTRNHKYIYKYYNVH